MIKIVSEKDEILWLSRHNNDIAINWTFPNEDDFHLEISLEQAQELIQKLQELLVEPSH